MSKSKKSMDWWDIALWAGAFLLILIFLYQLLKLWAAGAVTASNAAQAVQQAFANTVAAVENGLQTLVTAPGTFLNNFLGLVPSFLSLLTNFLTAFTFGGVISGIISFFTGILSNLFTSAAPISSGTGSSTTTTGLPSSAGPANSLGTSGADFSAPLASPTVSTTP
jgi:phage-related minor tail protein